MSDEDSIDAFLRTLEAGIRDSGFGGLETTRQQEHPALIPTAHLAFKLGHDSSATIGEKS